MSDRDCSAEGSALILRYGVTKFNDVETREQLVAMLEKVDTWFASKLGR